MHTRPAPHFSYLHCALLLLALTPFVWAAFYTFPFGDDFGRAALARHPFDLYGGLKEMFRAWWRWSGRYSHHFIIVFLGDLVTWRAGYAALCIGHFALYVVALRGIYAETAPRQSSSTHLFLALFTLLATLCTYTPLNVPWYLATDIFGNGMAGAFTLLYIWALCRIWNSPEPVLPRRDAVFAVGSLVFAAGAYEYSTIMVAGISLSAYFFAWRYRHPQLRFFRTLSLTAIVCFVLSFGARGNFRRRTKMEVPSDIIAQQVADVWLHWRLYVAPRFISLFFVFLALASSWLRPGIKKPVTDYIPVWLLWLTAMAACGLFTLGLSFLQALTDTPISVYAKLQSSMIWFCGILFVFCAVNSHHTTLFQALTRIPVWLSLGVCLAACILSPNWLNTAWPLVNGTFTEYARQMERRQGFFTARQNTDVLVAPLSLCPFPVCHGEALSTQPKDWPNKYARNIYGLTSVAVAPVNPTQAYLAAGPLDWRQLPTSLGAPHGAALRGAYARNVAGGDNVTYEFDWIFIQAPEKAPLPARLYAAAWGSWLMPPAGAAAPGPETPAFLAPAWLPLRPESHAFDPAQPPYRVDAAHTPGFIVTAIPIRVPGNNDSAALYLSADGKTFYKAF